jgi:hypothetical protein
MTLRLDQVAAQLPEFIERYREGLAAMEDGLRAAATAIEAWSADPAAGDRAIREVMAGSSEPYALSFPPSGERPGEVFDPPPFSPVTVVAADGSSIEPDRFAAVQCYVVNTGFIVLPYGLPQDPEIGSQPEVGPRAPGDGGEDDGSEDQPLRGWGVNLRRDVAELETGARFAVERAAEGPTVLLMDGTFFPWDLDSPRVAEPVRRELGDRTRAALDAMAGARPSLATGAYVSGSRSADLVTSLRALGGRPGLAWPGGDALLCARRLGHGQRTALFRASSERVRNVERSFSERHQVCFFYLRFEDDIARVELPRWVAEDAARVRLLHATLFDQCQRCGGYPRALQEAHEQAVISTGDRLQFARLLEGEALRHGLRTPANSKSMSKRRRAL